MSSGVMLVLLSKSSVNSTWVEKEVSVALCDRLAKEDVKVIPAMIGDCSLPDSFHFLSDTLYVDFRKNYNLAIQQLVSVLGVRPPRQGLKLYTGKISNLAASAPASITVAMAEGLRKYCKYDRFTETLALYMAYSDRDEEPVLEIPLLQKEVSAFQGFREITGWGYYDLHEPQDRYHACVGVSFVSAYLEPRKLILFLDERRRAAVRYSMNIVNGEDIFESPYD